MNSVNANRKYFVLALIVITLNGFSCKGQQQKEAEQDTIEQIAEEPPEPTRAELVMKALQMGYPQEITVVEYRDDDWAVLMHDTWYYYCEGRLLPEDIRNEIESHRTQMFYRYLIELPPFTIRPVPEPRTRNSATDTTQPRIVRRRSSFTDDLWQSRNRNESYNNSRSVRFLGKNVRVHFKIVNVLATVEERIVEEAKSDRSIQTWINSLMQPESWSWRNIAISESRSYHSYGVAIDLRPRSIGRLQTYWLWTSQHRNDWINVPYEERYHPPQAVINIFEAYGFAWGGKWVRFDTMHFEYRPEILILSGMTPESMEIDN